MISNLQGRPPLRRLRPTEHAADGSPSPAWLTVQAAQLAREIRSILQLINGTQLNLTEELAAQTAVTEILTNTAHASVILESGMPLAASWADGPPRTRAVFARAREVGSDPYEVTPDIVLPPKPPVPLELRTALTAAEQRDVVPGAQCGAYTRRGRCTRKIFAGIGSDHCHMHFTDEEERRCDRLQTVRERLRQAEYEALAAQQAQLAETWLHRYSNCGE